MLLTLNQDYRVPLVAVRYEWIFSDRDASGLMDVIR